MTDPTHTTNEEIALLRGCKKLPAGEGKPIWRVPNRYIPGIFNLHSDPPDYEHDWAHAGPLLDELWAAGYYLSHDFSHDNVDGRFFWWSPGGYAPEPLDDDREDTTDVRLATALDWLAWRKEKA